MGISGASGAILGIRLLEALQTIEECETHPVMSSGAVQTIALETDFTPSDVEALANQVHSIDDIAATIASGSLKTNGMVIAPCSMKTLAGLAAGDSTNLLIRAADVCLKEGHKVILLPRETLLNLIHLENLTRVARAGCLIYPPMLSFYNHPRTIDDMVDHMIGKILARFQLEYKRFRPWQGTLRHFSYSQDRCLAFLP